MAGVIYIAGYGRSGSTLLDRLLGTHPDVVSGGELFRAPAIFADPEAKCTCGAGFRDCAVWADHRALVQEMIQQHGDVDTLRRHLRGIEGRGALKPTSPDWVRMFQSAETALLQRKPGARWIVDSSKTARAAATRPMRLADRREVRIILLTRSVQDVVKSAWRGTNRSIEAEAPKGGPKAALSALGGWIAAEAANETLRRRFPTATIFPLRMETLLAEPEQVLDRLAGFLDLDPDPLRASLAAPLPTGHLIGGNRARFSTAPLQRRPAAPADRASRIAGALGRNLSRWRLA